MKSIFCCIASPKGITRNDSKVSEGELVVDDLLGAYKSKFSEKIRKYSLKEIRSATNNYNYRLSFNNSDENYGLYKGYIRGKSVLIMKFKNSPNAYQLCYNTMGHALHLDNENIVKLVGICMRSPIPILVFEGVNYGTLIDRIHFKRHAIFDRFSWKKRLNIAMGVANAMSYLHDGLKKPIISRNINLSNVVFDEQGRAKIFDFTQAIFIPKGSSVKSDMDVEPPSFYMAPEYATTGEFNEKTDVYMFGMVLLQLLIGQEIVESSDYEHLILRERLEKIVTNNKLNEVVDPFIFEEGLCATKKQQLKDFINVVLKCTCEVSEDRPSMVDVAQQIRKICENGVDFEC